MNGAVDRETIGMNRNRLFVIVDYLILLFALLLRAWRITAVPIWYDEAFSWYHASRMVHGHLVDTVLHLLDKDTLFPAYNLLLSLWIAVAGDSEFALHFVGVLLGVASVAVVGRWVREMVRREAGWGAMLTAAVLPILVHYHQEVRWIAPAVFLSSVAGWSAWRVVQGERREWVFVLSMLGAMLFHSLVSFMYVVLCVGVSAVLALDGRWRALRRWVIAALTVALLFSPVALWSVRQGMADATAPESIDWMDVLGFLPVAFSSHGYLPAWWALVMRWMALAVFVVGMCVLFARSRRAFTLAVFGLVIPLLFYVAVGFVSGKCVPRYLLPSFGLWYVVVVGTGLSSIAAMALRGRWWWRPLLALPLLFLFLALVAVAVRAGLLPKDTTATVEDYPDFRSIARYVEEHEAPSDAILVVAGPARLVMNYYYTGQAPVYGLPEGDVFDLLHPLDWRDTWRVQRIASTARRVWLVLWWDYQVDPSGMVLNSLLENCDRLPVGDTFTNASLLLFDTSSCAIRSTPKNEVDARFDNGLALLGYTLHRRPDAVILDVWWSAAAVVDDDYTAFVHLFRTPEQTPENLIAQDDRLIGSEWYPTSRWEVGAVLRTHHVLAVGDLRCSECLLRIGTYTPDRGRSHLVSFDPGGDAVEVPLFISERTVQVNEAEARLSP